MAHRKFRKQSLENKKKCTDCHETRTDMGVASGWSVVGGGGAGRKKPRGSFGWLEGRPVVLQRRPAVQPGWPPATLWQPLHGLAEARWVLADFGGLFGLVRGPIFNLKDAGTQVQYTMKQTKEIWGKTGLLFDRNEFLKFGQWKWPKKVKNDQRMEQRFYFSPTLM